MIDLDLRDLANVNDRLDRGLKGIPRRIEILMLRCPSVLWIGNDHHIYQLLEELSLRKRKDFLGFDDPAGKVL
jgi:hypothetical protein